MNASPPQLNPVNTVQSLSTAGKQHDADTPDVAFSQVLSSEMAQHRRGKSDASEASPPVTVDTASQTPTVPEVALLVPVKMAELEALPSDLPQVDAQPVVPETGLLALPISPDQLKPAPVSADIELAEQATTLEPATQDALGARKGRSQTAQLTQQLSVEAAGTRKTDATQTEKVAAAAFSAQLATSKQSDSMKSAEQLTDFMANPAMRATPNASLEAPQVASHLAANKLAPSVGTMAWNQALGDKVVWMAAGAQQSASLTLNPPNLGPLQIVLNISNDQATANFFSAQPEVRQALEAAFPKLREMMNEAGIQLGQATVSADTPQQQNEASDRQANRSVPAFPGAEGMDGSGLQDVALPTRQIGRGLVDMFA